LLAADPPTIEQRMAYEQVLVNNVFDAIEGVGGLSEYRLGPEHIDESNQFMSPNEGIKTNNNLNGLSVEIDNFANGQRAYTTDFECEKMSAIKGLVMQRVEDSIMPADNGEGGILLSA
jgi:hypothetical protein